MSSKPPPCYIDQSNDSLPRDKQINKDLALLTNPGKYHCYPRYLCDVVAKIITTEGREFTSL